MATFCAFSSAFSSPKRKEFFMPVSLDLGRIKAESRSLLRSGTVSPLKMTALLLAITLVLDVIDSAVSYMIDTSGGLTVLSFSFVSILASLISIVLNAGYLCYCLGIRRGEHMPYESLFDAFSFAGKAILLSIVEGIFIGLWSLLFVVPGIIAAYRYSFAMMDLCENPDLGVMEALDLSKQQTYGYKGQLFMLSLSFFGWLLLAGVASSAALTTFSRSRRPPRSRRPCLPRSSSSSSRALRALCSRRISACRSAASTCASRRATLRSSPSSRKAIPGTTISDF